MRQTTDAMMITTKPAATAPTIMKVVLESCDGAASSGGGVIMTMDATHAGISVYVMGSCLVCTTVVVRLHESCSSLRRAV
jgi:hypothetical protein